MPRNVLHTKYRPPGEEVSTGRLVIIGGKEDRQEQKRILALIKEFTGGGPVAVITLASAYSQDELYEDYQQAFLSLGVSDVRHVNAVSRQDAMTDEMVQKMAGVQCVFFTGGDQFRLTSQLGGTPLFDAVEDVFRSGGVIAGTSAGASAMSETMIVGWSYSSEQSGGHTAQMAPGFGLVSGAMIDQHFIERGRFGRLLTAVAQNPKELGIGIDEDTAIIVEGDTFRVFGSGEVYLIDGAQITYSTMTETDPTRVPSVFNIIVHVLGEGDTFDFATRTPNITPQSTEPRESLEEMQVDARARRDVH